MPENRTELSAPSYREDAQDGIKRIIEAGVEKHYDALLGKARNLCRNDSAAKDLVQATCEKALRFANRFDGENTKAWLFKILFNTFINKLRGQKMASKRESEDRESLAFESEKRHQALGLPEVILKDVEYLIKAIRGRLILGQKILNALKEIDPERAHVVLLVDMAGYNYREASHLLGIPQGTLMSRLDRGRKSLKKLLNAYAREEHFLEANPEAGLRKKSLPEKEAGATSRSKAA